MKGTVIVFLLLILIADTHAYDEDAYLAYNGDDYSRNRRHAEADDMGGEELKILVKVFPPYVMCKASDAENQDGDDDTCTQIGIIPDLLYQMSKQANFNISYVQSTETWDGMLDALIADEQYDMVAAPIPITTEREEKVDFLQPFAHVRISAIIQKPDIRYREEKNEKRIASSRSGKTYHEHHWDYRFNIGEPFAPETWVTASAMLVVVWLLMACMNRYNPYEHGWRFENDLGSEEEARLFNLSGALWYVFSTLQLQGYDRRPRSWAVRLLSCFWMSFALITIVSYIGSSTNHMFWADSVRRVDPTLSPLSELDDVIHHKDGYDYGTIRDSAAYKYITNGSRMDWAKDMTAYFEGKGSRHLVDNEEEGYNMLRTSRYVFLVEDKVAQYEMSKEPCDLMETGIKLGMLSYGFAIRQGDANKDILNKAMLNLAAGGYVESLEQSWFAPDAFCSVTEEVKKTIDAIRYWRLKEPGRVSFDEYWSVVVLIVVGTAVSIITAGIEIFWYKYRGRYRSAYYSGSNWNTSS